MKFRLRIGPVEIEIEGDEIADKRDVLELASAAAELYKEKGLVNDQPASLVESTERTKLRIQGSTASIASRLNCISGPELVIAAAARITFVDGEEWIEPHQLLSEMKQAGAHYEASYQAELRKDIEELIDTGKLIEVSPNLFALTATMRRELHRALAE
jgi:hypothetical protein